ncbi:programmed cell death protein 5-like [Hydra vulgaris]|uniref:Programmed cell death protein 5-like n=1 Tax=Hydra vulgaris TaxID=6087 RepID=A0ABM4DKX8_HYDVU
MADDPELEAIRSQRLAQMQSQVPNGDQQQQEAMKRELEMKNAMLTQLLDQGARARLNSIALVKPEKAKMVENMIIQMARTGQISGKLNEQSLVNILERINQQMTKESKVVINRRRYSIDSDND